MPQQKSRIAQAIRRDQGAPQKLSAAEQFAGAGMDDVDRNDFPEIEIIDDSKLVPNNGKRNGQLGTT